MLLLKLYNFRLLTGHSEYHPNSTTYRSSKLRHLQILPAQTLTGHLNSNTYRPSKLRHSHVSQRRGWYNETCLWYYRPSLERTQYYYGFCACTRDLAFPARVCCNNKLTLTLKQISKYLYWFYIRSILYNRCPVCKKFHFRICPES